MQWLEPKKHHNEEILIDCPSQRYLDQAYQDRHLKKCTVILIVERVNSDNCNVKIPI